MLNQNMETFFFSLPSKIKMRNTDFFFGKTGLKTPNFKIKIYGKQWLKQIIAIEQCSCGLKSVLRRKYHI
jgi:hypothetical protein